MSSISSLLATYLLTGLTIGFGHCIGMCGPLVISFSLNLQNKNATVPHLLYHCGRIFTYTLLGAVMGASGSFTMVAANIRSLQIGAMFFAGGLVLVMGLAMGGWIPRVRIFNLNVTPTGFTVRIFSKLSKSASATAYFPLGILLGLLPCGPVYTALLGAARAGMAATDIYQGLFQGMALMAAFGLGTAPALFIVSKLANTGWLKFRESIYKVGAVLMIGLGIFFIVGALRY
jgi:sulfite exporter TauE/SafE